MRLMNFIENELVGDDGEDDDSNVDDEGKDDDKIVELDHSLDAAVDIINPGPSSSTTTTTTTTSSSTRVLRSKGFFWLASRPRDTMIWSQAGGLFHLTNGGAWWADTPKSEWPNVDGSAIHDSSSGGSIDDSSNQMILLDTTSKIIRYHDSDDDDDGGGDVTDDDDDDDVEEVQAMLDQINSDWQEPYGDRRYQ